MLGNDPNQAADALERWAQDLERKAQQYQELHGRMAAVSITETSADNRIAVTVDANGVTTAITLASATRGMDPAAVAAELMACTHRAQARLRTQVTDMVHNAVGTDTAGAAIIDQYTERFPDPIPTPPSAHTPPHVPPTPPVPPPGTRAPDRDQAYLPPEPDEDDLYFRRKSWLE